MVALAACASPVAPRGALPAAPSAGELANDGSAASQERVQKRFEVRVSDERVVVGDAVRPARAGVLGTELDGDVARYLAVDESGGVRTALAGTGLGIAIASGAVFLVGLPIPLVAGALAVSGLDIAANMSVRNPTTRPVAIQVGILTSIAATLSVSALGALLVMGGLAVLGTGMILMQVARHLTERALDDAVRGHNQALQARIQDAAAAKDPHAP